MRISVSMLSSYIYCKRKLFIEKVLGIKEEPKKATVKGSIRHKIFEIMSEREKGIIVSVTKEDTLYNIVKKYSSVFGEILRIVFEKYKYKLKAVEIRPLDLFKEIWPMFLEESKERGKYLWDLIKEHRVYGAELLQKLPEAEPEYKIYSEKYNLIGIIDKIEFIDNNPVPIEFKTGKMPYDGVWPGHKIQLAAYSLLIEEKYEKRVNEGYVHYLDYKEKRRVVFNPFMKQEVIELINKVNLLMDSKEPPEMPKNTNKCVSCKLKHICKNNEIMDNELQKTLNIS